MSVAKRSSGSLFERPIKADLDRSLSLLMHEHRHKLMEQINTIKSNAIKLGALQSSRLIVTCAKAADAVHQEAMKQATAILFDFIERMQLPPTEITDWSRPHLENLGNALLGVVPPNGFPADYKRIRAQYEAVFIQRLKGILRDVEIGLTKGVGFARAEKMENVEEWITAAEAVSSLTPICGSTYSVRMTICKRAHAGLIRSQAQRLTIDNRTYDNAPVPDKFWWAEGHQALEQDWSFGDFSTWIALAEITGNPHLSAGKIHAKAFGVRFARADIDKAISGTAVATTAPATVAAPASARATKGGRHPADWWDDLLIELCFRYFHGDFKPAKQAEIEDAMHQWITGHGQNAATSTVRRRAQKLWHAIQRDMADN
jgi:hypothetical protein